MLFRSDPDGAHDVSHLRRVWRAARAILAEEPGADREVVLAATWFHDVVNVRKDDPDRARASVRSAELALRILPGLGFPADRLEALRHAIEAHSFSAGIEPRTREAMIVQDADRLDALGAIGLARCFHVGGLMGASIYAPDDPLGTARPLDDRRYSLDHLEVKLFPVAASMRTVPGRRIAAERAAWMRAFRDRLVDEAG